MPGQSDFENYAHHYSGIILLGWGILLAVAWLLVRPRSSDSRFKVFEADRAKSKSTDENQKETPKVPPRLEGIRLDGEPHEILGLSQTASADEIKRAYRDLMKRFHPDKVGLQGSREWKDAQSIAEAINWAKNEMLKKVGGHDS